MHILRAPQIASLFALLRHVAVAERAGSLGEQGHAALRANGESE